MNRPSCAAWYNVRGDGGLPAPQDISLNKSTLLALGLIVLISAALGASILTRDHAWGDDFAAYIMQAQSILQGNMQAFIQHNSFTIERSSYNIGPVTQLWGFPLLLAPAVAAFGLDILSLKYVMTLLHAGFLVVFFLLASTRLDSPRSLLAVALVAFNPLWLQAQNAILSDLPFALFSTLALWLMLRRPSAQASSSRQVGRGMLLGAAIFLAAFTRWTGWLLLLPLAVMQAPPLWRQARAGERMFRPLLLASVPYVTLAALYALQSGIFPSLGYPLQDQFADLSRDTVWANLGYYFWLPASFFDHVFGLGKPIQAALLVLYLLSALKRGRRDLPIHLYVLATLIVLVAFPARGGARFLYPIWPLFILFAFDGLLWSMDRLRAAHQLAAMPVGYAAWVVLVLISLAACVQAGRANLSAGRMPPRADWGAFAPTSMDMYNFVRSRTDVESVIIFFKPRLMRLMTARDSILIARCSNLRRGDVVVLDRKLGLGQQVSPREITTCNPALSLTPVFANEDFLAYQIAPLH